MKANINRIKEHTCLLNLALFLVFVVHHLTCIENRMPTIVISCGLNMRE